LKLAVTQVAGSFGFAGATTPGAYSTTATIQASSTDSDIQAAIADDKVRWEIVSSIVSLSDIFDNGVQPTGYNGLTWGAIALSVSSQQSNQTSMNGSPPVTGDTAQLTDIIGSRTVIVKATIDDMSGVESDPYPVTFGAGPLSVLRIPGGGSIPTAQWANAVDDTMTNVTQLPAAALCLGKATDSDPTTWGSYFTNYTSWTSGDHTAATGLPTLAELQAVFLPDGNGGNRAALAAGWAYDWENYWTGIQNAANRMTSVFGTNGSENQNSGPSDEFNVVCRR
jgi:hypothetical protein